MNNKLNEFIIKHNDFYNLLSEKYKNVISDLDSYGDLENYSVSNIESKENWTFSTYTDYLYIGKKDDCLFVYKCNYDFNNKKNISVSKGILLKIRLNDSRNFKYYE